MIHEGHEDTQRKVLREPSCSSWMYSLDHGQLCQVIEAQTLWGETTCRVWLPGRDSVAPFSGCSLGKRGNVEVGVTQVDPSRRIDARKGGPL